MKRVYPKRFNQDSMSLLPAEVNKFDIANCCLDISDENLFYSIIENSSNIIVLTDSERNIIYVNHKFEEVSGYSKEQVVGKNPRFLKSNKTPAATYDSLSKALAEGKSWKGDFTNKHPSGREYIEEALITPLKDIYGDIKFYLAEKTNVTELRRAQKEIWNLAYLDQLTSLPNREQFLEQLKTRIIQNKPSCRCFSLLFIDLRRFKELNDVHGHTYGDIVLKIVARRFQAETGANDFLARVGGDEFAVLHSITDPDSTEQTAMRITQSLDSSISVDGQEHYLGITIGSAQWPKDGDNAKPLLIAADVAMNQAKAQHINYCAYDVDIGNTLSQQAKMGHALERAVSLNELTFVYQPKVELSTGSIVGAEALLRWNNHQFNHIGPDVFIPLAESRNLLNEIGDWVIEESCRTLKKWQGETAFTYPLSINVSVQQLDNPNFYQKLMLAVSNYGLTPDQIDLEVTESVMIRDSGRVISLLEKLSDVGFSISIDDFGKGYSSLSYLKHLPVNHLKIDRSFICRLEYEKDDRSIVKFMVDLAHNLGLKVIAEGIETFAQHQYLSSIGCDYGQGYYYSTPVNFLQITELFLSGESLLNN
ncbi:sensor domain-containing protein [Vibrio viridaestus]|uniref:Phosphodiesterase n=1 Tax=Vibrio viridaestus TaxID=2487322 RepID=A0A3N9TLA0_9VIBR|nr:GGDEF domain-containing phosphodiesterase [Vibrio viridaestus]RQW64764.1 phosphodiesterase [Vibrio viridaestus]